MKRSQSPQSISGEKILVTPTKMLEEGKMKREKGKKENTVILRFFDTLTSQVWKKRNA